MKKNKLDIINIRDVVVETLYDLFSKDISKINSGVDLAPNWVTNLVEELIMKYLTSRTDVHLGNIGITQQGQFRYFDPAYSGWCSNMNI